MTKREFVQRMMPACAGAKEAGARFNLAVCIAQSTLESSWGNSGLTVKANNLFGIKAGKDYKGQTILLPTREWSKEKGWYKTMAAWRVYPDWKACVLGYAILLHSRSWFKDALQYVDNADLFLRALLPEADQPGWATDPEYFHKVRAAGSLVEQLGGPKWA